MPSDQKQEALHDQDEEALTRDLLQRIGAASPDLIFAKDLHGRMIFANPAMQTMLGLSWEHIRGRRDSEWNPDPAEAQRCMEVDSRVMTRGEMEIVEEMLSGPAGRNCYLSTRCPLRDTDGEVVGLFGISMNINARKAEETHQRFVMDEMTHRVKNTLATVQAMARRTLRKSGISDAVWQAFEGRLIAMSTAHDLLMRERWVGADVASVVRESMKAHKSDGSGAFDIDGPPAMIDAQTALALAMALHELGTNALKYGALSVPGGRISIRWSVDDDARGRVLDFRWNESGGPVVEPPTHRGFGTELIKQAFARYGANSAQVDYLRQGVEFRARIVLEDGSDAPHVSA